MKRIFPNLPVKNSMIILSFKAPQERVIEYAVYSTKEGKSSNHRHRMNSNQRAVGCSNLRRTYGNQVFRGVSEEFRPPLNCSQKADTIEIGWCTPLSQSLGSMHSFGGRLAHDSRSANVCVQMVELLCCPQDTYDTEESPGNVVSEEQRAKLPILLVTLIVPIEKAQHWDLGP